MRLGHIQVVILVATVLLAGNAKLLHDQAPLPLSSDYSTELNFTQRSLERSLADIVTKLEFVQATLKQVSPNLVPNISLLAPKIVGWTS